MDNTNSYFFCGIGGSGMHPLASILKAAGATVAGSDRALDQGRSAPKFDGLRAQGIMLFPQDGSGIVSGNQILVASAAIEDDVPDVVAAAAFGCRRITRAELLAEQFNAATCTIAVGGTSGKSTVTGMIGWILTEAGRSPTIVNGAVMKNFSNADHPFASSRIGNGEIFVSEVDESDGSIALFRPDVAVLTNVSLDHKGLDELRTLFGDFLGRARGAMWNADDRESAALVRRLKLRNAVSFGFGISADLRVGEVEEAPFASRFTLHVGAQTLPVTLNLPGLHNVMNAIAAIAATRSVGVAPADAAAALASFAGLTRRFERVGTTGKNGKAITVIDDFGHNPDKVAATLATLKAFPGRIIAFFQPHGFGPIKVMGRELAGVFATMLDGTDRVIICDPAYFGGTVDRSTGSELIVDTVNTIAGQKGVKAEHIAAREDCGRRIAKIARPGDRIVVMGARDDTLSDFARSILARLT